MKHSLTASERRGAIILAIISFILIGAGIMIPRCSSNIEIQEQVPVEEILVKGDTTRNKIKKSDKNKSSRKGNKKTKEKKTYRQRSPLDEPVSPEPVSP